MKFFLALTLFALASAAPAPAKQGAKSYIIKFKTPIHAAVTQLVKTVNARLPKSLAGSTQVNKIKYQYDAKLFNGVAGKFTSDFLDELKSQHGGDVAYVAEDGVKHLYAAGSQATPPSWGLARVGERNLDLTASYQYPASAGQGVDVWVVDTGVQDSHSDFGGRAKMVKSFVNETTDGNGHGTHVSGTVGSKTYGVAKKAKIFGVKVMMDDGTGQDSDIVAGIEYVAQNVRQGKTVLSMSLGGGKTQTIDDACDAAVSSGVVIIVAAGNDGADACQDSPAGASSVFAVGATDNTDTMADFSNYGQCVKVNAPGVDIVSLWIGANGATNTISGTSMATPHVSGVAALYMSAKTYSSPQEVYADLQAFATNGDVQGIPDSATPNLLAYATPEAAN